MGNPLKLLFLLIIGFTITTCEIADIPGMFVSDENVNLRFEQSIEWNARHPSREINIAMDEYFMYAMGDSHVGGTTNLDTLLKRSVTLNAQAVVMVGDLTTGHAEDYEVFQQHLPSKDSLPIFLIPGNHDLYFEGWTDFYSRFGSSTYFFTVNTSIASDLFICLDTGGGTLGKRQLDWFKGILEDVRPEHRRCIVFTHNNLFRFRRTASTNPNVEELKVLLELFSYHDVDMVVTAHDHQHYAQKFGNTQHIVMDALKDGLSNAGYFQLNVVNGNLSFSFRKVP